MKTKELKPEETKPIRYDNYFLNGLAEIRESIKPSDFNNLIYRFKDPNLAPMVLEVHNIKVYMMAIWL